MPHTVNRLHKIRHRIVQRTIEETGSGMVIRALLLGRDGTLRLFTARSVDSRDLLQILEPGRVLPSGVTRDVVDWSPLVRVDGFRPFEILDKLSASLDVVEEQLSVAEERVAVQKAALTSGDLKALRALPAPARTRDDPVRAISAGSAPTRAAPDNARVVATPAKRDPFEIFERVEAVAAVPESPTAPARAERAEVEDVGDVVAIADVTDDAAIVAEPEEWPEPGSLRPRPPLGATGNDRVVI